MEQNSRFRLSKFTIIVIFFGAIVGTGLLWRSMLPKPMRYELDDFFKRPFIPHFIVSINLFKPVPQQELINDITARGFDLKCYGGLAPTERVSPNDDFHCWTTLKSAFDNIPARDLRFWFQKGVLVHARFEFPPGELAHLHAYLNRLLDSKMAQHLRPGNQLGVDNFGYPIMSWYTPNGVITVNGVEVQGQTNTLLWSSWASYTEQLAGREKTGATTSEAQLIIQRGLAR